jgi:hypothetical protein
LAYLVFLNQITLSICSIVLNILKIKGGTTAFPAALIDSILHLENFILSNSIVFLSHIGFDFGKLVQSSISEIVGCNFIF